MDKILLPIVLVFILLGALWIFAFPFYVASFLYQRWTVRKKQGSVPPTKFLKIYILSLVLLIAGGTGLSFYLLRQHLIYKQEEAQTNLYSIFTHQASYFSEHHTYSDNFSLMNWMPEHQFEYTFFCGSDSIAYSMGESDKPYSPTNISWPAGIRPSSSATGFTCFAVGNIDNDTDLDYWYINDANKLVNQPSDL